MGCDIHIYVEGRERGSTNWKLLLPEDDERVYRSRNYDLFGMLAGVRRRDVQIYEARGIPPDASTEVAKAFDERGDHTPSWLTFHELLQIHYSGMCTRFEKWIWDTLDPKHEVCGERYCVEDLRIVFWFDN